MACYIVPAVAAIAHFFMRKNPKYNNKHNLWLNQLFLGGAIFGLVDHAWNRELFLFSMKDLYLGITITAVIFIAWKIITIRDKISLKNSVIN